MNYPAPAFAARDDSVHNSNASSVCGAYVAHNGDGENRGNLNNAEGSYLQSVILPQGARVRRLSIFVNDNDGEADVHAYLIRKRIQGGLDPKERGYKIMAQVSSSGAVNNVMRSFREETIKGAVIDNTHFHVLHRAGRLPCHRALHRARGVHELR